MQTSISPLDESRSTLVTCPGAVSANAAWFGERGLDCSRAAAPPQLVRRKRAARAKLLVEAAQAEVVPEAHLDHRTVAAHDVDLPTVALATRLLGHPAAHPLQGGGPRVRGVALLGLAHANQDDGDQCGDHPGEEEKRTPSYHLSMFHRPGKNPA
jgi:hypothetical protein